MTIVATPLPLNAPPKVTVDISVPAGSVMTSVSVFRNGPGGRELLRTQPSAGFDSRSVSDYEAPYGVPLTYDWVSQYVAPGSILFAETWASLAAWTATGGGWSVSSGKLIWTGADDLTAKVARTVSSALYQVKFTVPPTGFSKIDFGGFYIDIPASRLWVGASSVPFVPGSGAWTIETANSSVSLTTTAGTYSVATGAAIGKVEFVGALRVPAYTSKFGVLGAGDGEFNSPRGMAVDPSGNIYIADRDNNRIQKFNSAGVFQMKFGTLGTGDGQLTGPRDVAVDSTGNIFVLDTGNRRVQKFSSAGAYVSKFGTSGSGDGQFTTPGGIAIDSSNNIFVADTGNNRVQKFNSAGTFLLKFGTYGTTDGLLSLPAAIAIDSSGNIFVADEGNVRIQKFNSSGVYVSKFSTPTNPDYLAIDALGQIYVLGYGARLYKYTAAGSLLGTVGSTGTGDGQFATQPRGLGLDSSGNPWVVDTFNNRVQKFTLSVTSGSPITLTDYGTPSTITETSASVTLSPADAWLVSVATPALSFPLTGTNPFIAGIDSIGSVVNKTYATTHQILGSDLPVTTTSGPRGADETDLGIYTATSAERVALRALLKPDIPLLIQIPPDWQYEFECGFYAVGDVEEARQSDPRHITHMRRFKLPLTKVQSPVVAVENSGWSYAALAQEISNYTTVLSTFATYADLASNTRS